MHSIKYIIYKHAQVSDYYACMYVGPLGLCGETYREGYVRIIWTDSFDFFATCGSKHSSNDITMYINRYAGSLIKPWNLGD